MPLANGFPLAGSGHWTANGGGHLPEFAHEAAEIAEGEALEPIGQGLNWIGVYLDEQAIGTSGQRSLGQAGDQFKMAGSVAWVGQDRQVAVALHNADGADVEREAGIGFESAYAALAEDYLLVALSKQVVRRRKPLDDG
jgi:hypothetical protein